MKIKFKHGDGCAILFAILITIFYTIQGSALYFEQLKFIVFFAALLAIFSITRKINGKVGYKVLWTVFVVLCVVISFVNTHDTRVIFALFAVVLGALYDVDELIEATFWTKLVSFLFVMIFGGYSHINGCALHGGVILLLYIAKKGNAIKARNIFLCLIVYLILSFYTKSGSIIICGGFVIVTLMLRKNNCIHNIILSRIMKYIFLICLAVNIGFAILFYSNIPSFLLNFLRWIDMLVSHRIELAAYSLMKFGVSLWGGTVNYNLLEPNGLKYFTIDSGYIWMLQGTGILFTVCFIICIVLTLNYFINAGNYSLVVVAITIALWGLNEDMLLSLGMNFIYYYIGYAINEIYLKRKKGKIIYEYS